MIVTGDRDVFQLIDPDGLVKVMATSRGITDTKIYDHQAVIDRYGIPPELIPDFYGLKGDTSDNIPGVPGIGDKTASELIQTYGSLEDVLGHIREIGGAKRKQNLLDHGEDARVSKRLATVQRDLEIEIDLDAEVSREPDRSRLREFFRQYELRDPLRRLEEALGEEELAAGAPRGPATEVRLRARVRSGAPADIAGFATGDALCVVVRETETPEGALFAEGSPWRFAVAPAGAGGHRCGATRTSGAGRLAPKPVRRSRCSPAIAPGPRRSSPRARGGRWSCTTPRRCAPSRRCSCTTRCSAPTCWSPRGAAIRSPSCAKSAGCCATPRTPWRRTRCCWARSPPGSASRSQSAAWIGSWPRSSCRSCRCCARWS